MTKWSGNTWLGWAFVLFSASLVSTVVALFAGSSFDPESLSRSDDAERRPQLVGVLLVSILIPALSAAASVIAVLTRPREAWRTTMALLILVLALASVWVCGELGFESIR